MEKRIFRNWMAVYIVIIYLIFFFVYYVEYARGEIRGIVKPLNGTYVANQNGYKPCYGYVRDNAGSDWCGDGPRWDTPYDNYQIIAWICDDEAHIMRYLRAPYNGWIGNDAYTVLQGLTVIPLDEWPSNDQSNRPSYATYCQACPDADGDNVPDDHDCYPDDPSKYGKLTITTFYCDDNGTRVGAILRDICGNTYSLGEGPNGNNVYLNVNAQDKFIYEKIPANDGSCEIDIDASHIIGVSCFADFGPGDEDNPPDWEPDQNATCLENSMTNCGCGGATYCKDGKWQPCIGSDCDRDGVRTPDDPDDSDPYRTRSPGYLPHDDNDSNPNDLPVPDYAPPVIPPAPGPDSGGGGTDNMTIINDGNNSGQIIADAPTWEIPGGPDYSPVLDIDVPETRSVKDTILDRINQFRKFKTDIEISGPYCSFDVDIFGHIKTIDWCWLSNVLDILGPIIVSFAGLYAFLIIIGKA